MTANGVGNLFFLPVSLFLITARDRHKGVSFFFFFFFLKPLQIHTISWGSKIWCGLRSRCGTNALRLVTDLPAQGRPLAAGCHQITKFHFKNSAFIFFWGGAGLWGKQRWQNPAATADFERRSRRISLEVQWLRGFPGGSVSKESTCNVGDPGLIPGLGRLSEGGHGNPLQYSCPKNPHRQRSLAGYSLWGPKSWTLLSG